MSSRKDDVIITWNSRQYKFDGLLGKYIGYCSAGFISGGIIGAGIGSFIGFSVAATSPIILCAAAVKLAKQIRLK
jgi:hypothetical protein